jgi:hypothetical protein
MDVRITRKFVNILLESIGVESIFFQALEPRLHKMTKDPNKEPARVNFCCSIPVAELARIKINKSINRG